KKPGKKLNLPGFFIIQYWFSSLNKCIFNPLNYLFSLIKLFAQLLHLVTVRHQHNLQNAHLEVGVKHFRDWDIQIMTDILCTQRLMP
ncbi:TPA: hypothetical protein ACGHOV_004847, partial [Salmonella enterica subsp. enterica serovar Oslo]